MNDVIKTPHRRSYPGFCAVGPALLATVVMLLLTIVATTSSAEERTFVYTVKAGDSCMGLAQKFYNSKKMWNLIHKHNNLGPLPHHLKAGQKLILPLLIEDPDARVTGRRGEVRAKPPSKPSWKNANVGLGLYRSWQVNSRQESSAELTFLDTSRLYMRENTLVVVYGNTSQKARRRTTSAELQYGTLRARLSQVAPGGRSLNVSTKSSETELTGGEALVDVDKEKVTRVANHRGKPASVYSKKAKAKKRKPVVVAAGMGSKVKEGQEPTPPKPLPPAPDWATAKERAVFVSANTPSIDVAFAWKKVAKAVKYRIELFEDAERTKSVVAVPFPAPGAALPTDDVLRMELKDQKPGSYYVTVSSIDNDKFEGTPSQVASYTAVPLKALGPNNAWLENLDDVPMGTRLTLPLGFKCKLNAKPAASPLLLVQPGKNQLLCDPPKGSNPVKLEFTIEKVGSDVKPLTRDAKTLPRQASTRVKIELSEDFHAALKVVPSEGVEVGTMTKVAPKTWEVVITTDATTPDNVTLPLVIDADGAPVVGSLDIEMSDTIIAEEEDRLFVWSGGIFFDYGLFYGSGAEGDPAQDRNLLRPGLRLTLLLDDLLMIEVEGAPVFDVPSGDAAAFTRLGYRAQAGVLFGGSSFGNGAFRPFILVGHGSDLPLEGDETEVQPINYLALGARWATSDDNGLRFELRQGLVNQGTEFAYQTSGLIGFYLGF